MASISTTTLTVRVSPTQLRLLRELVALDATYRAAEGAEYHDHLLLQRRLRNATTVERIEHQPSAGVVHSVTERLQPIDQVLCHHPQLAVVR